MDDQEFARRRAADACIELGHEPDSCRNDPDNDDDGDDDEVPIDGEGFDGGFGFGSYFQQAMSKDD